MSNHGSCPETPALASRFNAGNAAWRNGDWSEALAAYTEVTVCDAGIALAHLGRARCLVQLAQWPLARAAFADTLRLDPANYSAWLEAGHLCRQMGELQQAAGAYQRAIDVAPGRYEAPLSMARVLQSMGQSALSARAFEQAMVNTRIKALQDGQPDLPAEVAWRMGKFLLELGELSAAVQAFYLALQEALAPASVNLPAEIRIDLCEALWRLGRHSEAQGVFAAASAATVEPTLSRLATLCFRFNQWKEAEALLRRCVALYPQSAIAHWNLAHLLAECWQMDEAMSILQQAEALAPIPGALGMRASIAGRQGDADKALQIYRQLARAPDAPMSLSSSAAMAALYSDKLSAQAVADLHVEMFASLGEGARAASSFVRAPLAGRRIRLGMVSADFHHQHPVNIFMQPLLRELDRSRFEVFLYFTGVNYDPQTRLAQQRVEHWVESRNLNDMQLARRIDADAIDLLLDLAGHTGLQRMSLFGQRAAPVQATFLGYPASTGVPNMDWLIADPVVAPQGSESLFSERIARLPNTVFCFAPEVDYPYPEYTQAQATRPLTFGSFNNVPKLTPHTVALWAAVLKAVPDARLLLKAPSFGDDAAIRAFRQRFADVGVDQSRLEFRGPVSLADMMAEYLDVDIALDPVPYNGGTTTLQALWMGVPVVVKAGGNFVSRMGASFMQSAGMADWVAQDDAEYVQIAVRAAQDRQALLALKQGLRATLCRQPGWDIRRYTRDFEVALIYMLDNCRKLEL